MLSIFSGPNFLEFNAMELFASIAIVLGVLWAIRGHFKERSRKNSLITYPDTWKATRMLSKESFEVRADVHILLPYNSYFVELYVREIGKTWKPLRFVNLRVRKIGNPVKMETLDVEPAVHSKKGRLVVTGNAPLASLPANVKEVKVWTEITLDGAVHRKSKKRTLPITDHGVTPSTPDKEGSQN